MKQLIQFIVRKRNGSFTWPEHLSAGILLGFAWTQALNLLRGSQSLWGMRSPKMMLRGRNVSIVGKKLFRWGAYLRLGDNVYVNAIGTEGITLGEKVGIGAYSRLIVSGDISNPGKGIRIGNHVGIGEFAYLGGAGGLEIGDHCIAGQYLSCHPENHVTDNPELPVRLQGVTRKGIKIGSNCWIGSKVTILDGVTIGNNCIIAAGAVVNKSFPDNCTIGGVPARIIKQNGQDAAKNISLSSTYLSLADAI